MIRATTERRWSDELRLAWRISRHFPSATLRGYVLGKITSDPVYAASHALLRDSPHPLLDLGCGVGLLGFYLRERGFAPAIEGADTDTRKISIGRSVAASHYPGISLSVREIAAREDLAGNVALLDVVHYLPAIERAALLAHISENLLPGRLCILRTCLRDASWRSRVTMAEENFARRIGWLPMRHLDFPKEEEMRGAFDGDRYEALIRPLWGRTPFNSYLMAFRRRA